MRPGVLHGLGVAYPRWFTCPECERPGLKLWTDAKGSGLWYDSHDAYRNGLNTGRPCPRVQEPVTPEVREMIHTALFEMLLQSS